MVKIMEHPIKIDDLGVFPLFLETPISISMILLGSMAVWVDKPHNGYNVMVIQKLVHTDFQLSRNFICSFSYC